MKNKGCRIGYSGYQDTLDVTIHWRDLEVIIDAIKEYEAKYETFDKRTQDTFDTLKEILKEQEG